MRRQLRPFASLALLFTTAPSRSFVSCKGIVENRIQKHYYNKTASEVRAEMLSQEEKHKHPNPQNKKEAMEHLTRNPSYEYTGDLQRAANDMMAIYSDPQGYSHDMAYHYHRIWKAKNPSRSNIDDGNDSFEIVKIFPK